MMKKRDQMTSLERIEAIAKGQAVDRVPFVHKGYVFCAKMTGAPVADIYDNPESSFETQKHTFEMFGCDGTPFYTFSAYGSWEFGGEVKWPDDRMGSGPTVAKHPIEKPEDVWKLSVPDVRTAGSVPRMMEFARLQDKHKMPIACITGSPFSHAANLVGVTTFLTWMIDAPEAVHQALRLMTDHAISVAQYFVNTFGKDRVIARGVAATDSNALISPHQFKEFAFPYIKELHEKILEIGVQSIYEHVCGNHNKNLQHWAQIPFSNRADRPGTASIGHEVDLLDAEKAFPGQVIAGNIDPQIIARGTPDDVYQASRACIEKGKTLKSGFIFMAGCEVPPNAPPYNVYVMRKAIEDFGWY